MSMVARRPHRARACTDYGRGDGSEFAGRLALRPTNSDAALTMSAKKGKITFVEVPQPAVIVRSAPGVRRMPACVREHTADVSRAGAETLEPQY